MATTQGLNDSMACKQSNGVTMQADVFDTIRPKISALPWQLDDAMDECYNNELLKKATIGK